MNALSCRTAHISQRSLTNLSSTLHDINKLLCVKQSWEPPTDTFHHTSFVSPAPPPAALSFFFYTSPSIGNNNPGKVGGALIYTHTHIFQQLDDWLSGHVVLRIQVRVHTQMALPRPSEKNMQPGMFSDLSICDKSFCHLWQELFPDNGWDAVTNQGPWQPFV